VSDLERLLACPVCHGALDGLACTACGRAYREDRGVPDLTPLPPPDEDVSSRWALWEQLQANGERSYADDPALSLSVGEREDAAAFAGFARLEGAVLDVGCGPQARPSYAGGEPFVGIDPLVGRQPRDFAFVKGVAEYLPFADGAFDRVLFATSLDHVLSPERTLAEARRVTRPGGAVVVWLGELVPPPSAAQQARNALRRLARGDVRGVAADARAEVRRRRAGDPAAAYAVPEGAADAFHFSHPDGETVAGWLEQAGLTVDTLERPLDNHCFIRAVPR